MVVQEMRLDGATATPPTILVIDDDSGVTETFARMLALGGYNVRCSLNAEEGLREVGDGHVDAILLDLRMPRVDGLAFLRRLRAHASGGQTPVAIVTGDYFFDEAVSDELEALNAQVYFKPLWVEELTRITDRLLQLRG
jgi:DNA-binding response OmpR family regulator